KLEYEKRGKYGPKRKYAQHLLEITDIYLRCISDDSLLQSYVVNSTATRHDMDSLAELYLDRQTIHFEDIAGKGAKQLTFNQIALEQAGPYAAEDAEVVVALRKVLDEQLQSIPSLNAVYRDIELPLVSVLQRIERNGALIDVKALATQSQDHAEKLAVLEQQAHEMAGEPFNLNSPKQLQAILFEKLEIPVIKKTPKGQPSTAEPILQELALDYPLPEVIMQYRTLNKLKTTYTDKLPQQVCPNTGRIHTSYHQAVTATGRLSSSDPNLQNIPIRTAEGRRVRQAFIAPKNHAIVAADYSQIELRIMAHLSGDDGLLNAFKAGEDIHRATASEVFAIPLADVDSEHRRRAKAINFGLIYGMSAFGLGKQLGIGRNEAQDYIDLYFERYPGVLRYMNDTRELAAKQGYVETLFGRRLHLSEINSRNAMRRQAAERTAINAPMQGSAADIIKMAMINVHDWIESNDIPVRMIMQVHDELVFEVPKAEREVVTSTIVDLMSTAATLDVPLVVDAGFGANWDEAH
ncbi:DNA polymerase I, partial [bacterium]|nr:DNA polymerase I [bacterium]